VTTPLPDIVAEADRVLVAAHAAAVPVRLIGGLAIRRQIADLQPSLRREYHDIDLATPKGRAPDVTILLDGIGYMPAREFNALNGARRLMFLDTHNDRKIDVFVGGFAMCHSVPISDRMEIDPDTIPLAELLLTKLQVVELNEKDMRDIVALLLNRPVGSGDVDEINADFIANLLANDWGLWRTTRQNLEHVRSTLQHYRLTPEQSERVLGQCDDLWTRIEARPKSRSWRLRDRVGDRKRWYEEPDEVA
jgi:hypothetical protein